MDRDPLSSIRATSIYALALLAACGGGTPAPPAEDESESPPAAGGELAARTYEHNFVFVSFDPDSLLLVPWLTRAQETADSVHRSATGWLARGGAWEEFYAETWSTGASRAPGRVLPYAALTFVVREGDAIDGIIFEEGPRSLELVLGDATGSWVGPRGEAVEVLDGAAFVSDTRVEGSVLDLARVSSVGGEPGGDWAFLLSGDSARFVLAADAEYGGDAEPRYRGWGDLPDDARIQWADVRVDWRRAQAFPPARRDVPVAWRVWSTDGSVEGELQAVSSEISAGTGPGPLLPVRALFEVEGRLATAEGDFEVRGVLVHERR